MNILVIAFRNVGRNRRRSILSAAAIAISTMVIVFMFALIEGLKKDISSNVFLSLTGQVRVRNLEYEANEIRNPLHLGVADAAGALELLEALPEVRLLSPRISFPSAIYREGGTYRGMGVGIDVRREEAFRGLSRNLVEGAMPAMGKREVALSAGLARDMGVGVGDKITLFTKNATGGMNGMTLLVTGILRFGVGVFDNSYFFPPLDTVQRLLGMGGSVTEILVLLKQGRDPDRAAQGIQAALQATGRPELSAKPWTRIGIWHAYLSLADSIYTIFALGFILLGTTVVINTTMMVIYERVREIGTMSAMGMTSLQVVGLFFLESCIIGAIGSLAGVAAGIAVTLPMSVHGIDFTQTIKGTRLEMSSIYYPILNPRSTLLAGLYAVAVSSLVSIIPSRRASRIEPVKALRSV